MARRIGWWRSGGSFSRGSVSRVNSSRTPSRSSVASSSSSSNKSSGDGIWGGIKSFFSGSSNSSSNSSVKSGPQNMGGGYGAGANMGIGYTPTWIKDSSGKMPYITSAELANSPQTTVPSRRDSNGRVKTTPQQRHDWGRAMGLGNWSSAPTDTKTSDAFWGSGKTSIFNMNGGWDSKTATWGDSKPVIWGNSKPATSTATVWGGNSKWRGTNSNNFTSSRFYAGSPSVRSFNSSSNINATTSTPVGWRKFSDLEINNISAKIAREKDPNRQRMLLEKYKKAFWDKGYDVSWFDRFPIWAKISAKDKSQLRNRNQNPISQNGPTSMLGLNNRSNALLNNKTRNQFLNFVNNLKNKGKGNDAGQKEDTQKLKIEKLDNQGFNTPASWAVWGNPKFWTAANKAEIAWSNKRDWSIGWEVKGNQKYGPFAPNTSGIDAFIRSLKKWENNGKWWEVKGNQNWFKEDTPINNTEKRATAVDGNNAIANEAYDYAMDNWKVQKYTAENGKTYEVFTTPEGRYAFKSKVDGSVKAFDNFQEMMNTINKNNSMEGVNREDVANKDAVRGGEIQWSYVAPSGKKYQILTGTGPNKDKIWFVGIKWEVKWFDSWNAAKNDIDVNNPVGHKDLASNTPLPELNKESYTGEDGLPKTWVDEIDEANEFNKNEEKETEERIEDFVDKTNKEIEYLKNQWDEAYNRKLDVLQQQFGDVDRFWKEVDAAIDELKKKSELIQDNEKMRWARQRAAEMAAQGYLTSEQVAQVANYSLADYTKELRDAAAQADKAIAELRLSIAQKKQEAIADIRKNQMLTENDRLAQENYVSEKYDKMLQYATNKWAESKQFYDSNVNSNLGANIQNKLGIKSIIQQNDAQNIVDDRNKMRAYNDSVYRQKYILSNISDANLHSYAQKAINYLISQGKFIKPWLSNEANQRLLSEQISNITAAAQKMQMDDMLKAKK